MDEALEELESCDFTRDERRDLESRLPDLRVYDGVTCSLELAFDHQARFYVYEVRPDWYEEFLSIGDEIAGTCHADGRRRRRRLAGRLLLQQLMAAAALARCPILPANSQQVAALASALGIGAARGRASSARRESPRSPTRRARFLHPSLDDLHDPHLLLGMDAALDASAARHRRREKILIYGDYDVDGTTSVVILKKAIELAGGAAAFSRAAPPARTATACGRKWWRRPRAQGVKLIISVDTGIRAAEVVRRANELGIDVIITDHHLPEAELPPALAVLNPNRPDCAYPEKNLCGVGVAFKLVQALLATLGLAAGEGARASSNRS